VAKSKLPRLVLKELAENALDTGAKVKIGRLPEMEDAGYFVEDAGPGIDGTPEDIARLFSLHRPMISSKYLRPPQRGALGNGLRVVSGAVLASEASLTVITRDKRIELRPERDGTTTVTSVKPVKFPVGTQYAVDWQGWRSHRPWHQSSRRVRQSVRAPGSRSCLVRQREN
jgi:DNA topoisomerase VI subunit B